MFECVWGECDRLFDTKTARNRHTNVCRKGATFKQVPRYYCSVCDSSFYILTEYTRHMRGKRHAKLCGGFFVKRHACEFAGAGCEKTFMRAEFARRHALRCAHNPAPIPAVEKVACPVENCGARMDPRNLARHVARKHTRTIFTCDVCILSKDSSLRRDRNFYTTEALARHKHLYHPK